MGIFDIFFKSRKVKLNNIDSILNRLMVLSNDNSKNKDEFDNRIEMEKLYKNLSKMLFDSVLKRDYTVLEKIFTNKFIICRNLVDENGYDIIEYLLLNNEDEIFKDLYKNYYDFIYQYLGNIPKLFTIVLNKQNWNIIEFFLTNSGLSDELKKENIVNCFFNAIQSNKKNITDFIVSNFNDMLDVRNIEASFIYSISHNQIEELRSLLFYDDIILKFSPESIEKMFVFSIMNHNVNALEIMLSNQHIMNYVEKFNKDVIKTILNMAYNDGNIGIINMFKQNYVLKDEVKNILRIE